MSRALQEHKRRVAKEFSALAYRQVTEGIIRLDDRRRLAKAARRAGIREFDGQILIACAVRRWSLDQAGREKEERGENEECGESQQRGESRRKGRVRMALPAAMVVLAAVAMDAVIILWWL